MADFLDDLRKDRQPLLDALAASGADIRRPTAMRCPFHDDKTPSAGIYQDDDGVWRFKCQASMCGFGGDVFDVRAKSHGRRLEDVLREERVKNPKPAHRTKPSSPAWPNEDAWVKAHDYVAAVYRYTDPVTRKADLLKIRIEPPGEKKTFKQAHLNDKGHVIGSAPPSPWPIYNRTRVAAATVVIVVEGEKCVEALHRANVVATCGSAGAGAGKASLTDWSPLKGKTVYLWPDHDAPDASGERGGHVFMREVAAQLDGLDCRVLWIDPDRLDMGDKEDAADYLARFDPEAYGDAIGEVFDAATPMGAASDLQAHFDDAISGRRWTIPFPWLALSRLSRAIQPGMVTVFCGDPGSKKSFAMIQCAVHWFNQGIDVRTYMLEDDKPFHLARALAQVSGIPDITDSEWVRQNPQTVADAMAKHAPFLNAFGRKMTDCPDAVLSYGQTLDWIRRSCESGGQILIIDPITQVDAGKEPWRADKDFIVAARAILRKYKAHLILVTHPRSAKHTYDMDGVAGSRGFSRFPQSILWLRRHPANSTAIVHTAVGQTSEYIDASLKLLKARNGKSAEGVSVALKFNDQHLTFKELGVIDGKVSEP